MKNVKSFSISNGILDEIAHTRGADSTRERVNKVLKHALELERGERLEHEAGKFFAEESASSLTETAAFHKACKKSLSRNRS
jgi:hypothetical protein